ncbi:Spx/MgsR family RNA polymerase-binding regulatory protein [Pseudalkalibacillus caeni]|uniref:Spx/MgsR family RNA polymerase-binding regulatory protein n=1 Tax=Exobacillus caeni TaxID=2574798 RepID=A0A5R9F0Y4_9BACL|nr:Spx/MgsR family RNA polymerase-binding regulatory protein [Pseudalkalibacillus caeni]TLS36339.1 Spx/MgsR family RNA polymerase-binding regulatory protein [Pseudalkalibacillus caeni]
MKERLLFYTYPSCTSCRKTKKWLKENNVDFEERHLFKETPTVEELKEILKITTEGVEEILAKRSRSFKNLNLDVENLTVNELLALMNKEPKLLRRPLITNGKKLIVGFDKSGLNNLKQKKNAFQMNVS